MLEFQLGIPVATCTAELILSGLVLSSSPPPVLSCRVFCPVVSCAQAWCDYGHQLGNLAQRSSYVDSSAQNASQLGAVGRVLVSSEQQGYKLLRRHGVDYVMVVFGGFAPGLV